MKTTTLTRLASMLLDHAIMSMVSVLFFMPMMLSAFMQSLSRSGSFSTNDPLSLDSGSPFLYLAPIGYALYLCKDSFDGRSVAKRIIGFQVVGVRSGRAATPIQCLIRNLFIVLWPIEVIVTLSNPERRIGDRVAGTKVVSYNKESADKARPNIPQAIVAFLVAYIAFLSLLLFMANLFNA